MGLCDLHIHSTYSDGTYTPGKIVEKAEEKNLLAISITDHDEVGAIGIARAHGKERNIFVLSGCELSAIYKEMDIHILGYLFDENEREFTEKLLKISEYREERAKKILRKLEDYGCNIEFDSVKKLAGKGSIGRPHIAQAMLGEKCIDEYNEAFWKYIGNGKPCCVPKFRLSIKETIELIRKAGGIPVLAHPGNIRSEDIINELLEFEFAGLEVWHPEHSSRQIETFLEISRERSLVATGGSDNHGDIPSKSPIGGIKVDSSVVDMLNEYKDTYL